MCWNVDGGWSGEEKEKRQRERCGCCCLVVDNWILWLGVYFGCSFEFLDVVVSDLINQI